MNVVQILSYIFCIIGIVAASAIVENRNYIFYVDFQYYFFWSFCLMLVLFLCDLFRNMILEREKQQSKKI
jgi:hypothetical protein